jgi:glyoxylase-like metal-dependent hydrolase (beta-lactamase superfamily II)
MAVQIDQRRLGDAVITAIFDATDGWIPGWQVPEAEWRRAMPEADAAGEIAFDTSVFHIRRRDASVLVDLGHGDAPERYMPARPDRRGPPLIEALASVGVRPDEVTHVVITHAHGDHFYGATVGSRGEQPRFPNARHLIGRSDWEGNPARTRAGSAEAVELGALARLGRLETVDGDLTIAPGIDVLHAPGESPGHQVVRLRSGGHSFYCLGDLFHHPAEVEHLDWLPAGRDPDASRLSRQRLVAAAVREQALLAFTHAAFPAWGRIVQSAHGQRWEPVRVDVVRYDREDMMMMRRRSSSNPKR